MTLQTGPRTGHRMKFYYNSATIETPTWVEVGNIEDLDVDYKRSMATIERRANDFAKNLPSLVDVIGVSFKLFFGFDKATIWDAIRDAFVAGTPLQVAVCEDTITESGCEYLSIPILVEEFPWSQPLKDASSHAVKLSCAYMENATNVEVDPAWVVVT
ncbi:MAG: hypothetical protein ACWGQW_06210 [bacterium]